MTDRLAFLQRIASRASDYNDFSGPNSIDEVHPFDERNIHPSIAKVSIKLFDDGHFSQATFEAFKFVDKRVGKLAGSRQSGMKLMMNAFNEDNPKIRLNDLVSASDLDEQSGFRFIFAGSTAAIRNPRGHEVNLPDDVDKCLDHLSLASMLLRTLDKRK